jgi:outer membrane lipoprotein carrier protein
MTRRSFSALLTLCGIAACLSAVIAPALAAPELSAEALAGRVQEFYDKTKTFKAGFDQAFYIRSQDVYKRSKGQVIFQKPGKMSWRYTTNGNRVVSDGKVVKVFEKENKQMYEQAIDKSAYPAALTFLVGGGSLRKEFKLKKLDPRQLNFEGGYVLLAVPRKPTPAYQKMLLYVDAGTYQVRRVLILDAQGNRNRFDFLQPAVNVAVPKNEFTFTPPPGTQLVRP